jgi:hypothetical protein
MIYLDLVFFLFQLITFILNFAQNHKVMRKRLFFVLLFLFSINILYSESTPLHVTERNQNVYWDLGNDFWSGYSNDKNLECFIISQKMLVPVACSFSTSRDIGTTLLLSWTAFPDASSFVIQYRLPGGSWIGNPAITNQIKLVNLTPNTYYECRIYIYKLGTFWNISQTGSFTTGSVSYAKSLDIGTAVQMSWNSFAPWATNYTIQCRPVGTSNWFGFPSNTNSAKLSGLIPNTNYECKVIVYSGGALWGVCQIGTFQTGEINVTKSQDMGTTLLMAWTGFPWASGYTLQYRILGSTSWVSAWSSTNQLKVSNVMPNSDYECRVIVYANGILWDYSAIDTIHTDLVVFNVIADNPTSMQIGWNSFSPWATSYTLQYRLPMSSYWVSAANTANTNIQISPLLNGQDYFIRLRVFIGSVLWGISQEGKIGRNLPSIKASSIEVEQFPEMSVRCSLFPNPFVETIHLTIVSKENHPCSWSMFDVSGREIHRSNVELFEGDNQVKIETPNLTKGVYFLEVMINHEKIGYKIVKQ